MPSDYINIARGRLAESLGVDLEPALLDLYTLLVLVKGDAVTLADVHDAWAVWRSRSNPAHRSIVPFDELTAEVQALDQPYATVIAATAARLGLACPECNEEDSDA